MANYNVKHLTNYFSVTDEDKFKELMASCKAENEIEVFEEKQSDGGVKVGFGCLGNIYGLPENEDEDCEESTDALYEALQGLLPNNEAIIITEIGYEKLNYFIAGCTILTHDDTKYIDARKEAVKLAGVMLKNPEYTTKMDY